MDLLKERLSRRRLLALGGALLAGELAGLRGVLAQSGRPLPVRIGIATPTRTGGKTVDASLYDFIGEAAMMGALLAEEEVGTDATQLGLQVDILPASSPSAEAALRAAERLVATEEVCALVGGLGEGQAEVMSDVAAEAGIPFFNIGSQQDALRNRGCRRTTFHVEASAAMYLDALAGAYRRDGNRSWFVVHAATAEGNALKDRALVALGNQVAGTAAVAPGQPVYNPQFDAIRKAEADIVLLLVDARDQIAFLAQYDSLGPEVTVAPYPHPVTQTRDYFATARYFAPKAGSGRRAVLWETTLGTNGAGRLNERFMSRWGVPMNPPGWAAYQSVKILFETVRATGTTESAALIGHLESPEAIFDLCKGAGTSFRPWDHQLRQPLYLDDIDPDAEYGTSLTQLVGLARLAEELPAGGAGGNPVERLDMLGDGPEASGCTF